MSVCCFVGIEGLKALKPAWTELFKVCVNPSFYNDWRWHLALQQHLIKQDVHYFAVFQGQLLIAIVPLILIQEPLKGFPIARLDFPRHPSLDCADLLIRRGKASVNILPEIIEHIREHDLFRWDLLELTRFTDRSGAFAVLGRHGLESMGQSAFIRREPSQTLGTFVSRKQVKNVRRHIENARGDHGPLEFSTVTEPKAIQRAYETFLAIEASGWKGNQGTGSAIQLQKGISDFYRTVVDEFAQTRQAVINLLKINGRPAAAQLGIHNQDTLSLLKIGYDESLRSIGPGGIALLRCLEDKPLGILELNLMTCPHWSRRWHFATETLWHTMYFNQTFLGRTLQAARRTYLWKRAAFPERSV